MQRLRKIEDFATFSFYAVIINKQEEQTLCQLSFKMRKQFSLLIQNSHDLERGSRQGHKNQYERVKLDRGK